MKRFCDKSDLSLQQGDVIYCFEIIEYIGMGAGCVAYKVTYETSDGVKHLGILKEYCPAYLEDYGDVRNSDGSIIIPEKVSKQFYDNLEKFRSVYVKINEYLLSSPEAANFHPVQMGLFEGNNTLYTLVSCDYGTSYDMLSDDNLKSLLNIVLSVTKGVELYHKAGFLHLDIKPANIFILQDVTELVKLFDYDSLTPLEDVRSGNVREIPCPGTYYVPELNQKRYREIGVQTDVFEIGAMLFLRLFGRAPESGDTSFDAEYGFDKCELLKGVSPKIIFEIETLLRHTLQTSIVSRYKTTAELKKQLEKLLGLVDSKSPYLLNMPKWQPTAGFVGRDDEVKEIHRRLQTDGYVFVCGIGGLGKSEIAKIYAEAYADEYHTVVFCKYTDSLANLTASLPIHGINVDEYKDFEKLVADKNQVLHDCDSHTLIIVDNFNVTYDKFLRDFLPAGSNGFKVIFTTRCVQANDYYENKTFSLPKLSFEDCETLFKYKSDKIFDLTELETLRQILVTIDRNTLILVLLASAVKSTNMSLAEALKRLDDQELDAISPEIFHEYDYDTDETEEYNKLLLHLYAVFSISDLSLNEIETLKDMTLVDMEGILCSELVEFCDSAAVTEEIIESLVAKSWIFADETGIISMHPTVSDLVANNKQIRKQQSYDKLATVLEQYCDPDYISHISVVLSRLSEARHLVRRYKTESLDKRILINAKLGRLYNNIYRPTEARKYLLESENLAKGSKHEYFLPYIYSFLGNLESDFGTITSAIDYFQQSIQYGKKPTIRYYEIVCESMVGIGECYMKNKQYDSATKQLKQALHIAKLFHYYDKIAIIAKCMIEINSELDLPDQKKKYQSLFEQYKNKTNDVERTDIELLDKIEQSSKQGHLSDLVAFHDEYVGNKREELGEESPLYKDISQGNWMKYFATGDKESAIRSITDDLDFVKETYGEYSMEMAERLVEITKLYPSFGEFDYAEESAHKALMICERLNEEKSYVYYSAKLALAVCYLPQYRLNEARQAVEDIDFNAFKGNEVLSDIITSAGLVLCELDMAETIEPLCVEFLSHDDTDYNGRIVANVIMSIINERRGDFEAAEQYAQKAKNNIDAIQDSKTKKYYLLHYYRPSARLAFRQGDCKKAVECLQELLSFYTKDEQMHFSLGTVYVELGLYFAGLDDLKAAEKSFNQAEEILKYNNMPKEAYIGLYNNLAVMMINAAQFETAKNYLDKIVDINPNVLNPRTYLDSVICGNIAWNAYNVSDADADYAIEMIQRSLGCFEKVGAHNTAEYATMKNNLAIVYFHTGQYKKAAKAMLESIEIFNNSSSNVNADAQIGRYKLYIISMLRIGKSKAAYAFAHNQASVFAERYGDKSIEYAEYYMEMGIAFGSVYLDICMEFFQIAQDCLEDGNNTKTVSYAKLLNYTGFYYSELQENFGKARNYYSDSKLLFEELNAETDEMYEIVVKNLEYVNDVLKKRNDKLFSKLVKSMLDNEEEE